MGKLKQRWIQGYKTHDFKQLIKNQNETIYKDMGVEVIPEKEGEWLEFVLIEDDKDQMFEEEIAKRRNKIINADE